MKVARKLLATVGAAAVLGLGSVAVPAAANAAGFVGCKAGTPVKIESVKTGPDGATRHHISGTNVATGGSFSKFYDYKSGRGHLTVTGAVSGNWSVSVNGDGLQSQGAWC